MPTTKQIKLIKYKNDKQIRYATKQALCPLSPHVLNSEGFFVSYPSKFLTLKNTDEDVYCLCPNCHNTKCSSSRSRRCRVCKQKAIAKNMITAIPRCERYKGGN